MQKLSITLCFALLFSTVDTARSEQTRSSSSTSGKTAALVDSISACRTLVWEKSEDEDDTDLLHGVTKLTVETYSRHPMLPDIDFESIRMAIEAKCSNAGLTVTNAADPKTPILSISIHPIGATSDNPLLKSKNHVWIISLDLFETSILSRDMKTRSRSRIYAYQQFKCVGKIKTNQTELEKNISDSVDLFIAQWNKTNNR